MNQQNIPQVNLSATESPTISLDAHTGDLLTTFWEQILSEITLNIYLNQHQTNEQGTHANG